MAKREDAPLHYLPPYPSKQLLPLILQFQDRVSERLREGEKEREREREREREGERERETE